MVARYKLIELLRPLVTTMAFERSANTFAVLLRQGQVERQFGWPARPNKQVVSWSEVVLLAKASIASNQSMWPFSLAGGEIKEGLIPVSLLQLHKGLREVFSFERFYQRETEP